jgi:probable rRNA maturation factor
VSTGTSESPAKKRARRPSSTPAARAKTPAARAKKSLAPEAIRSSLVFRDAGRRVRRAELHEFLEEIARRILRGRGVVCLLTGDDELRRLNRQFRGMDYATDVLSFPPDTGSTAGEIAISLDRASAQAAEHGHSVADEIRILMLHGVLHLTGMDHETDAGEMAEAEIRWRRRLDLPTGLIERANRPRLGRGGSRRTRA